MGAESLSHQTPRSGLANQGSKIAPGWGNWCKALGLPTKRFYVTLAGSTEGLGDHIHGE